MSNIDNATKSELLQAVEDEQIKIKQNIVKVSKERIYTTSNIRIGRSQRLCFNYNICPGFRFGTKIWTIINRQFYIYIERA